MVLEKQNEQIKKKIAKSKKTNKMEQNSVD
jgi:hypothetical protein